MILTDAAEAMRKLGRILRERGYSKMLHVLCMAHAIHNVIKTVRDCYPNVHKVIMGVKELFTNSHLRLKIFREVAPKGINRPPAPILTRFGTWVEAAAYYANRQNRDALLRALEKIKLGKSKGSGRNLDQRKIIKAF